MHSAISLMACFVQVAALFILLRSPFLVVVQIFVYVGAIMVLFVFVIMMLDFRQVLRQRFLPTGMKPTLIVLAILGIQMLFMFFSSDRLGEISAGGENPFEVTIMEFSVTLFTDYLLPFEVVSVILLVALIGAIVMAKRRTG